jgi:hypothetical protein
MCEMDGTGLEQSRIAGVFNGNGAPVCITKSVNFVAT